MKDIETVDDCGALVSAFYGAARQDPLLGPVFESRLADQWDVHLARMTGFWASVLLTLPAYRGRPVERHRGLPIDRAHFTRWIALWCESVDRGWQGPRAEHAKLAASRMADRLVAGLGALRATETSARSA